MEDKVIKLEEKLDTTPKKETNETPDLGTEKFNEMSPEEKFRALNTYSEMVQINARKDYLGKKIEEHNEMVDKMRGAMFKDKNADFIDEKVTSWIMEHSKSKDMKAAFISYIKDKENLEYFYTDPDTGNVLDVDLPATGGTKNATSKSFKHDFLLFVFSTIDSSMKIDEELAAYDEELKRFDKEYKDIMRILSDNILLYIDTLEESLKPEDPNYRKISREIKHIRAGYNMSMFKDVLVRYPSVIGKCITEMHKENEVEKISARYHQKIAKAGINISLVVFIDDDPKKSLEYLTLPKEYYEEGRENLFIWSLIRFFAMESWSDGTMKKLHASVFNVLSKLRKNDLPSELKESVVESIRDYLAVFRSFQG